MITFKKFLIYTASFIIIIFPIFVYAETQGGVNNGQQGGVNSPSGINGTIKIDNPLKKEIGDSFLGLLTAILNNIVMPIAAVFVVFWIIYAGFKYVTAQGNPAKIAEAHQTLLWALVGAGILLGAAGISKVVESTVDTLITP